MPCSSPGEDAQWLFTHPSRGAALGAVHNAMHGGPQVVLWPHANSRGKSSCTNRGGLAAFMTVGLGVALNVLVGADPPLPPKVGWAGPCARRFWGQPRYAGWSARTYAQANVHPVLKQANFHVRPQGTSRVFVHGPDLDPEMLARPKSCTF